MKTVVTIAGTHGYDDAWRRPSSPLGRYLTSLGVLVDDSFVWSTDLGGVGRGSGDLRVWEAAGINLYRHLVPLRCPAARLPADETILLSHSHGLQVALFALAHGLRADVLIDVAGPVREDLLPTARIARASVRRWVHVHGGRRDRWQWFGTLFDGAVGIRRAHPVAHENLAIPEADHSDTLTNPEYFSVIGRALLGQEVTR